MAQQDFYNFCLFDGRGYLRGYDISSYPDGHDLIMGDISYVKEYTVDQLQIYKDRLSTNNETLTAYDASTPENRPCNPVINYPYNQEPMGEGSIYDNGSDYSFLNADIEICNLIIRNSE